MLLNSEDLALHDQCQRFQTYTSLYQPFRVSLNFALNESLHAAFEGDKASLAADKFMALATRPGIDIDAAKLYESVIHHVRLAELVATYVLSVEKTSVPGPITTDWGKFQPRSFLMADGRLRRVVLCDRWNKDRENLERFSWRTASDTAITNRPMVITAIVIGGIKAGFRVSPWTQGYEHPQTREMRVQRREGEFNENWRTLYREQTDLKPLEWLRLMQSDGAFENRVFSVTEDVPKNRDEVLESISRMASEMGSLRQTRSACYRFRPCPFLKSCLEDQPPAQLGWVERPLSS